VNGGVFKARGRAGGGGCGISARQPQISGRRAARLCGIALLAVCMAVVDSARAQEPTEEYRVKAAFLFHFVQLTTWPEGSLGDVKDPITVCTVGKDPFDGALETTLQGKLIGTHPLRVEHFKSIQYVQGCQVLFIGSGEFAQIHAEIAELKNGTVLTVGETDDFAKQGGMIGFRRVDDKIRFDINVQAADRAKLKISSRLLLLAKDVIGNQE
jgi:YfiR/HmsC-like